MKIQTDGLGVVTLRAVTTQDEVFLAALVRAYVRGGVVVVKPVDTLHAYQSEISPETLDPEYVDEEHEAAINEYISFLDE